jgi:hypothetical protein
MHLLSWWRVIALLMLVARSESALSFQRPTDILGFASTFEADSGLPSRNFSIAVTTQSSSGRQRQLFFQSSYALSMYCLPIDGFIDVGLDDTSNMFYPVESLDAKDIFMSMRRWVVTYDDSARELSLFVNGGLVGNRTLDSVLFPNTGNIFGPDGIPTIYFGPFGQYSSDGVLSRAEDMRGLYGLMDSFELWDRALNASEIAEFASSPSELSAANEGLSVYFRMDRGYGNRVSNLGSAGAKYDAVLGRFASSVDTTSSTFGSGCDSEATTLPVWVNKTGNNTAPTAFNFSTSSVESRSVTMYFSGLDSDGDLLDFAITRLPSHGQLELESTLNASQPKIKISSNTPLLLIQNFARYRLLWWPEEGSNQATSIGYKAWDGTDYSAEATIVLSIIEIDDLPALAVTDDATDEDVPTNITLYANDIDSDFVAIFITDLPAHGTLYKVEEDGSRGDEIAISYSSWDVVEPFDQYASSVIAVSTFWPSGDDAGLAILRPAWLPPPYIPKRMCSQIMFVCRVWSGRQRLSIMASISDLRSTECTSKRLRRFSAFVECILDARRYCWRTTRGRRLYILCVRHMGILYAPRLYRIHRTGFQSVGVHPIGGGRRKLWKLLGDVGESMGRHYRPLADALHRRSGL